MVAFRDGLKGEFLDDLWGKTPTNFVLEAVMLQMVFQKRFAQSVHLNVAIVLGLALLACDDVLASCCPKDGNEELPHFVVSCWFRSVYPQGLFDEREPSSIDASFPSADS